MSRLFRTFTQQLICSSDVLLQSFIFTNSRGVQFKLQGPAQWRHGGSVYCFVALCVSDPANDKGGLLNLTNEVHCVASRLGLLPSEIERSALCSLKP